MKKCYSMALKTACFFLAVLCMTVAVLGITGACYMAHSGYYRTSSEKLMQDWYTQIIESSAGDMAQLYAQEDLEKLVRGLGDSYWYVTPEIGGQNWEQFNGRSNYRYEIFDQEGKLLASTYEGEPAAASVATEEAVYYYREVMRVDAHGDYYYDRDTETAWTYTVKGYILQDLPEDDGIRQISHWMHTAWHYRNWVVVFGILGAIGLIVAVVYLLSAAGHRQDKEEITLNLLDRIPLDLYAGAVIGCECLLCYWVSLALDYGRRYWTESWIPIAIVPACLVGGTVLALGLLLTTTTRLKYGGGYWWRHSVIGFLLRMTVRLCKYLWHGLKAIALMLPTILLWLVIGFVLWLFLLLTASELYYESGPFLLASIVSAVVIVYVAYSLGKLKKAIAQMAKGDLNTQVSTKRLHGTFRVMGQGLNQLSHGANLAVERQIKSERMKTELITNVSHDIKTPLTSIVNYVDLLQKPHTPEEEKTYLEVLERQSKRMKKLTEDLLEMSKASSGNLPVNLMPTNVVELVNQALAEYQEKLESRNLEAVIASCKNEVLVMADGRLFWRIMDNLLGNVVKYAQPGTRVYVDVAQYQSNVLISVKNISKDRLNISSEELLERFVRGDSSRNTEGSGLGLNIAKSLAELQQAKLNLVIDGDLFKAVLLFQALQTAPWQEDAKEP